MSTKPLMLIVDDAKINRTILTEIFQDNFSIQEASNGLEALRLLKSNLDISIILLDLVMPKMDGFEVLSCIKRDSTLSKIPVIVNTQAGESKNEILALDMGATDFISKPYNPDVIRRRIQNVMLKREAEHLRLQQELKDRTQQINALIETVPGGIAIYDVHQGAIIDIPYFNDAICNIYHYSRKEYEEIIHSDIMHLIYPEDRTGVASYLENAFSNGVAIHCSYRILQKEGTYAWVRLNATKFKEEKGHLIYHAVVLDITEEKRAEERIKLSMDLLQYHIKRDVLTGIYNRDMFLKTTEKMIKRFAQTPYVLLVLDMEHFKMINDAFGTQLGDEILKKLAKCLDNDLKGIATYGRLEADHFAVCMPYRMLDIDKMCTDIEKFVASFHLHYRMIINTGIYIICDKSISVEKMCDKAHLALQTIKGNYNRHYAFYDGEIRDKILKNQMITSQMETALAEKQFFICLQPIYDIVSHQIISAEVLVRWKHPKQGLISPSVFIPIFEKNGFITKLDVFVWEEACRFLKKIESKIPLTVNVSRMDLYNTNLCNILVSLIQKYNLDASMLKLEITETAYTDNSQQLLEMMRELKKYGFQFIMDDFGSGYSSLNMLKDLPVDVIKMDMKFIEDIETSQRAGNIMVSVLRMAKWLNMSVVVEGVETQTQVDFLRSVGCSQIQGIYFSKTIRPNEFQTLMETQKNFVLPQNTNSFLTDLDLDAIWKGDSYSNLLFNDMIDVMGIYELYQDHLELMRVNDGYYELFGEKPAHLLKKNVTLEKVHLGDQKLLLTTCQQAAQSHKICSAFIRRYHTNGSLLWVCVKVRCLGLIDDRYILYMTIHDITEQKNLECKNEKQIANIKSYRESLHILYDSLSCGIMSISYTKGKLSVLDYNSICCKICGYTSTLNFNRKIGSDYRELIYEDDRDNFINTVQKFLTSQKPCQLDYRIIKEDNSLGYVRQIFGFYSMENEKDIIQSVLLDITNEKNKEHEQILKKYSSALFSIYDEVFELNYTSNELYEIIRNKYVMTNARRTFPLDKSLHYWIQHFVHPEDRVSVIEFMDIKTLRQRTISHPESLVLEYRIIKKGEVLWCSSRLLQIYDDNYLCCNLNITDRKQREHAYQQELVYQSKKEEDIPYYSIASENGVVILEYNLVTKSFVATEGFYSYSISQQSLEDLLQNKIQNEAVFIDDLDKLTPFFHKIKGTKHSCSIELRLKKITGEYVWCLVSGMIFYDKTGTATKALGILYNIDAQKQTIDQLQDTEKIFYDIANNITLGVAVYEITDEIRPIYVNSKTCEIFGFTLEEYQKRIDRKEAIFFNAKEVYGAKNFSCNTGVSTSFEQIVCAYKKDKTPVWIRFLGRYVLTKDHTTLLYATIEDIKEKEDTKEEIEQQKEQVAGLLRNVPVGIAILAIDEGLKFIYVNEYGYQMLELNQLQEPDIAKIGINKILPDYTLFLKSYLAEHALPKNPIIYCLKAALPNGKEITLYTSITLVQTDSHLLGYLSFMDVTNYLKRNEEYLFQSELTKFIIEENNVLLFAYHVDEDRLDYAIQSTTGYVHKTMEHYMDKIVYSDVVHPKDKPAYISLINRLKSLSVNGMIEYRANYFGDGYHWYRANYKTICRQSKAKLIGIGTNIDVEKNFKNQMQTMPILNDPYFRDALFIYEFDLLTGECYLIHQRKDNEKFYYPYTSYVFSKENTELLHPDDRDNVLQTFCTENFINTFQNGISQFVIRYRIKNLTGKWVWVKTMINLVYNHDTKNIHGLSYTIELNHLDEKACD